MTASDIATLVISIISLIVSAFVAYMTLLQRFIGKIWASQAIVLTRLDGVPSFGLGCFVENQGAKPGYLEDMRLSVKHVQSGTSYFFYPLLTRNDYSIFENYTTKDWYPFSGFYLLAKDKLSKYILFKPLNDHFNALSGIYKVALEVKWRNDENWQQIAHNMDIEINPEIANQWNNPEAPSYQVFSNKILGGRI